MQQRERNGENERKRERNNIYSMTIEIHSLARNQSHVALKYYVSNKQTMRTKERRKKRNQTVET